MKKFDSTLLIIVGSLLLLVSAIVFLGGERVGITHPELFTETPFLGLCALVIGLLERRKGGA